MNIVIPMAGNGMRFYEAGIKTPKPLIKVLGKTLLEHSIESLGIEGRFFFIVKQYEDTSINEKIESIIYSLIPDAMIIVSSDKQMGASHSAMYAKEYINNDSPLIITNCDQRLIWNANKYLEFLKEDMDGSVVLFTSYDSRNSYAVIEKNIITNIVEKKPVSTDALIGLHYWKNGCDFVDSAEKLIADLSGEKEAYISETYNYLIKKGKKILPYHINNNEFISLGTPQSISGYLGNNNWILENE